MNKNIKNALLLAVLSIFPLFTLVRYLLEIDNFYFSLLASLFFPFLLVSQLSLVYMSNNIVFLILILVTSHFIYYYTLLLIISNLKINKLRAKLTWFIVLFYLLSLYVWLGFLGSYS